MKEGLMIDLQTECDTEMWAKQLIWNEDLAWQLETKGKTNQVICN